MAALGNTCRLLSAWLLVWPARADKGMKIARLRTGRPPGGWCWRVPVIRGQQVSSSVSSEGSSRCRSPTMAYACLGVIIAGVELQSCGEGEDAWCWSPDVHSTG